MPTQTIPKNHSSGQLDCTHLKFLSPDQIQMVDEALAGLGDFGELHLVVERGRLRFLTTQKSFDVLKWSPGSIQNNGR